MHLKVHHVVGRNLTQKENLLGNNYLVFHVPSLLSKYIFKY